MTASDLFRAGRLQDAISALTAEVKARPMDVGARTFLSELLCFAGEIDRADKQLDAISQLQPSSTVGVALFRQLLRAARWRQQCFTEGRPPEFSSPPSDAVRKHMEALVHLRTEDAAAALNLVAEAESLRAKPAGTCDGEPFDDLRDLDDRLAPVLEVFTANGSYYWFEWSQVISLALEPMKHPRDLLWRRGHVIVRDGLDADVHIPVLYPGSDQSADEAVRLGRSTAWEGNDGEPVRGIGQRMLLAGETDRPFLEIKHIAMNVPG